MSEFPSTADALTSEYLNSALKNAGMLKNGELSAFQFDMIGTGKMGDNARLSLEYSGDATGAPSTLVAKLPAADEHARTMAGAQGAYYSEVMFYRELAPKTTMRTPQIYASELSEDRCNFLLLMEDVSPATPGSQLKGESLAHTKWVLGEAAKLAASFYGQSSIGEAEYVMAAARDDGGEFGQALMIEYWPQFADRFGHGLTPEQLSFGAHYSANHAHFVSRFKGPKTVAHGDLRSENVLFSDTQDAATIVDWQTTSESSVMTDAAYFLGGSVSTEDRRQHEKSLIEEYRRSLDQHGVSLSFEECWNQYREFAMHGLMITVLGACFSTPDERSDKMFLAMIKGHLQHCLDVGSAEFLPAS